MLEDIEKNGVVGAGGGGFPAAVKLKSKASVFIVNAAECEPLLHKDKEILLHYRQPFLEGLRMAVQLTGAAEGVIGIKAKHKELIEALRKDLSGNLRVQLLSDTYPAGDEFLLVYDVTGKVIPPGGLPLHVGAVVNNVETVLNIGLDVPVTHKFLTVAGAVRHPVTLRVPVGTAAAECLKAAGGATEPDFEVISGGVMMGRRMETLEAPVTKTTGGFIVLPFEHSLARRYRRTDADVRRIGRSACDQCTFCTELCPRRLLGHPIEPHRAMRALGFEKDKDPSLVGTLYCCECNLCSLVSCPEDLDPKQVCVLGKVRAREKGLKWTGDASEVRAHPLLPYRRMPISRLKRKLGLARFLDEAPLSAREIRPSRVTLPLRQHAGVPAEPVVSPGDRVKAGDLVAATPAGKLGAPVHASIDGRVAGVSDAIVIEAA